MAPTLGTTARGESLYFAGIPAQVQTVRKTLARQYAQTEQNMYHHADKNNSVLIVLIAAKMPTVRTCLA
jgi:hypothetical protein